MRQNMQKIFFKRFILFVVLPILLLIAMGIPLLIHQIEKNELQNLDVMLSSYETSLEQEISEGSMKLSQFLLINENEMLKMMSEYSEVEGVIDYNKRKEMEERFNYLTTPDSNVEGIEFYFNNGKSYGYRTYISLTKSEIEECFWYKETKRGTDRVHVTIADVADFIPNVSGQNKKALLFLVSPERYDPKEQLDLVLMVQGCTIFDSLAGLSGTDYSAYIADDKGNVLLKSDERYVGQAEDLQSKSGIWNTISQSTRIYGTDWHLILIKDKGLILREYIQNIGFMLLISAIIFFVFYLFAWGFFNTLALPIATLTKEMQALDLKASSIEINTEAPYEIQQIQMQFNEMVCRIQNLVTVNQQNEYARHQEELKALQSQINPHFFSNTLNTIKFMAQVSKNEGIRQMTDALMQILDCSFRDFESTHTLEDEVHMLEAYLCIMKIRYAENFSVMIDIEEQCKGYRIPKLVLQPFIENALTHGLLDEMAEGRIKVGIHKAGKFIVIVIEDNGCGISNEILEQIKDGYETKAGRIGIANVLKRLPLYYGEDFVFLIESSLGVGTKVEIRIPVSN